MRPSSVALLLLGALAGCDRASSPPTAPAPTAEPSAPASAAPSASASAPAPPERVDIAPSAPPATIQTGGEHAVQSAHGLVSSEDRHATEAGVAALAQGGNAIDAAVATAYALAVTHPSAGALGGGGFMIIHLADGRVFALDYREVAPRKATVALNEKQLGEGAHGYLSAAVPGVVAGLEAARERFGSLSREVLLAPAIRLAEEGHAFSPRQALVLAWYWDRIDDPVMRAVLSRGTKKKPVTQGQRLRQSLLGETLERVAEEGRDGFYRGPVAKAIAEAMAANGGLVREEDLAAYEPKWREPLSLRYRGLDLHTMPPPSMGGIALVSMVQHMAANEGWTHDPATAPGTHLFLEAARRAYADRRAIGADPDFVADEAAPLRAKLLDPAYYRSYEPPIDMSTATASSAVTPIQDSPPGSPESPDTTHFSVVDAEGNAVSCTTTLSAAFGSRVMIPKIGVVFSNVMGAFSPDGVNTLAPGKRMSSSMSPTLLAQGGSVVAVFGSPGGDTIPNTVTQVLRHLVDGGATIDEAIDAPRLHHQYKPDRVRFETKKPPSTEVQEALGKLGHELRGSPAPLGAVNGVVVDPESHTAWGFADARKGGLAAGPEKRSP